MPIAFLRNSLFWRLIGPCLVGLLFVGSLTTAAWLSKFKTEIEDAFYQNARATTRIISKSVAISTWSFNEEQAAEILAGFAHIEAFSFAEITVDGQPFARFGEIDTETTHSDSFEGSLIDHGGKVTFSEPISFDGAENFAVLTTAFSTGPSQAVLRATRNATIAAQGLSFGLLGVLLAGVMLSVIRPLREITKVIEDVTAGQMKRDVPFRDRADEVGMLALAVSSFQENADALVSAKAEAEAIRRIAEQAGIDELTGLPNRRALIELFEKLEQETDPDEGMHVALLHIDLDGFKQVNDTLGHSAGDFVLRMVAERLQAQGDACTLIARMGGDEFVGVMCGGPGIEKRARTLSEALITHIGAPGNFDGQTLRVGCSIGLAYHTSGTLDLLETLIHADIALYEAKSAGKNRWVEFDDAQRLVVIERKALANSIESGLDRGEFVPRFQPIVDAQTHEIMALEVLARWNHPELGLTMPTKFLDLANELKLTRYIDRTVLEQSIDLMTTIAAPDQEIPRLSVNVSVERLMESDLLEVAKALEQSPVKFDIELLESTYLNDLSDRVLWHIDSLRELGVGIHIDDFGTGHSSLPELLRVSPDCIKIDRRLTSLAAHSPKERALVEAIIGLATSLGIQTTCEGIETREQAELMRTLGCDMLQGFYFGQPVSADAVPDEVRAGVPKHVPERRGERRP